MIPLDSHDSLGTFQEIHAVPPLWRDLFVPCVWSLVLLYNPEESTSQLYSSQVGCGIGLLQFRNRPESYFLTSKISDKNRCLWKVIIVCVLCFTFMLSHCWSVRNVLMFGVSCVYSGVMSIKWWIAIIWSFSPPPQVWGRRVVDDNRGYVSEFTLVSWSKDSGVTLKNTFLVSLVNFLVTRHLGPTV